MIWVEVFEEEEGRAGAVLIEMARIFTGCCTRNCKLSLVGNQVERVDWTQDLFMMFLSSQAGTLTF